MPDVTSDRRDMLAGALLVVLGLASGGYALAHYRVGSAASMGPGFFPVVLGGALALLGVAVGIAGWLRGRPGAPVVLKPRALLAVVAGVLAFAVAIRPLGFVPASFLLVVLSALADPASRPATIGLLAAGLTLLSWLIFVVGLGMPLAAFAW
ncbi:MAG: tripartite tricarboxylate transporter TctB family protein [Rhodobacteraceae bacterium]|nr:tripartite tricarboxylate transporter TctB family protein [Paracoccaceae bacterium]